MESMLGLIVATGVVIGVCRILQSMLYQRQQLVELRRIADALAAKAPPSPRPGDR